MGESDGDAMDEAGKGHVEMPTVSEAAAQVRNGEVSAEEPVAASLAAIERTNGDLNAFVHVDADGALQAAGEVLALFAGVPFGGERS